MMRVPGLTVSDLQVGLLVIDGDDAESGVRVNTGMSTADTKLTSRHLRVLRPMGSCYQEASLRAWPACLTQRPRGQACIWTYVEISVAHARVCA